MLLTDLEYRKRVVEASNAGRFFLTITYLDGEGELQHYMKQHRFPDEDVIPSLEKFAAMSLEQEPVLGSLEVGTPNHPKSKPKKDES